MESLILKDGTKCLLGSQLLTNHENASQTPDGHTKYLATEKLHVCFPVPQIHCVRRQSPKCLMTRLSSKPSHMAGKSDLS